MGTRLSVAADAATVSVKAPPVAPVELKSLDAVASATDKGGYPDRRYASIAGAARGARGPRPRSPSRRMGVSIFLKAVAADGCRKRTQTP